MKTNYKKVNCNPLMVMACFVLLIGANKALAQPTNKINYQAVARNVSGNVLQNQNIGLRISILNGNGGPSLYTETFNLNTNNFGLFTVQLGGGAMVSGNYNTINWSQGNQWLKVEMDPAGGNSYVNMGESQLLSVPYSMYSANSAQWSVTGNNISNANSGYVGIGTLSPQVQLHVVSTSDQPIAIDGVASMYVGLYEGGTYRGYLGSYSGVAQDVDIGTGTGNTTGSLHLTIEAAPVLTVDENENVGIGTTSPNAKLEVNGGTILVDQSLQSRFFEIRRGGAHRWAIREDATTGMEFYQIYDDAGTLINSVRMAVDDNGRVGVGTLAAAPLSTFNVSHVTGGLNLGMSVTNSTASSTWYFYSNANGNLTLGKGVNLGQFDGVSGVYTALSDRRVKNNVSSLSSVLPSVMKLDVKRYEYTRNNPQHRKSIGLMAQDVAPYFPELVYNFTDDAEGKDYLSLDYSGFGIIALKAIQEQQKMIEQLKAEIELLKAGQQVSK